MFDIGIWELFVVGLIALIVLGPERLPGVARTVGLWIGRARAAFYSVREEVEREIHADGLRETRRALKRELDEGARSVAQSLHAGNVSASPPSQPPEQTEPNVTDGPEDHSRGAEQAASPDLQQEPEVDRKESERSGGHRRQ